MTIHRHTWLRQALAIGFLLVAVCFCYQGLLQKSFILFDTNFYVADNPHVATGLNGANISWAFTSLEVANWHPLTWLSHMLDVSLFQLEPRGHHLHNLLLHFSNAVLLFLALWLGSKQRLAAFAVAILFAVHPLNVETVAWIAQRKSLLSTLFALLALLAYTRYVQSCRRRYYLASLIFFCLGLMSKPMLVTLPCALFLWDLWPLGRFSTGGNVGPRPMLAKMRSLAFEKIPFFAASGLVAWITVIAQEGTGAISSTATLPASIRIANAITAYGAYLKDFFLPGQLTVYYPHALAMPPLVQLLSWALVLLAISLVVLRALKRVPCLFAGWFWFVGWLVPVIGLVQVGEMSRADRYMYIPAMGLLLCLCFGLLPLARSRRAGGLLALAAVVFAVLLAVKTRAQVNLWKDSETLFRYTLAHSGANPIIENNLGVVYLAEERYKVAEDYFRKVLASRPKHVSANNNLGRALVGQGKLAEAIEVFNRALAASPSDPHLHVNLGKAHAAAGNMQAAMAFFRQAITLDPQTPEAYINAARSLPSKQRREAVPLLEEGLEHNPLDAPLYRELGIAMTRIKDYGGAIAQFHRALALDPVLPETHYFMGRAYEKANNLTAAHEYYTAETRLNPRAANAYYSLARSLKKQGKTSQAVHYYKKTVVADPGHHTARFEIARYYYSRGKVARVVKELNTILAQDAAHSDSHYLLGVIRAWRGEHAAAAASYQAALDANPDLIDAYEGLADSRRQLGRPEAAIDAYRLGLDRRPKWPSVMGKLAELLADKPDGDIAEAIRLAREADRLNADQDPGLLARLAQVYVKAGRVREARDSLRRALALAESKTDTELITTIEARLRALPPA